MSPHCPDPSRNPSKGIRMIVVPTGPRVVTSGEALVTVKLKVTLLAPETPSSAVTVTSYTPDGTHAESYVQVSWSRLL